jgi:hypothetical protein
MALLFAVPQYQLHRSVLPEPLKHACRKDDAASQGLSIATLSRRRNAGQHGYQQVCQLVCQLPFLVRLAQS